MRRVNWWWLAALVFVAGVFAGARSLVRARPPTLLEQAGFSFPAPTLPTDPSPDEWVLLVDRPEGPPRLSSGTLDALGRPVSVSCASCHAGRTPDSTVRTADELREFHTGLTFEHGTLSCLACHNARNYNLLTLADGSDLDFADVRTLCSQCHAPQARDWEHGAHGGMNGYWDAERGPRIRKICIDCHDPHAPRFPSMFPVFKPKDRFAGRPEMIEESKR